MSYTPPDPGIQQSFLDAFDGTTYDATEQGVRTPSGALLRPVLAAASNGDVVWQLEAPANCITCRLTETTYTVLLNGTLLSNGRVSYNGGTYRLRAERTTGGSAFASAVSA